ncbi:hypothetical protein [Lactobacillus acetotolerans]|jgi:hypothetical protein|uniref:Uncharacterized protein n=1 Tax=Lactobacillus acetotolerans TaxID=1600 RepID=A0A0D6A683_9LACO|nr:hypothetical protein [Lactobacillus acetotolerans]QFG51909.1 hypothetical protein LA749_07965 [Lactobacillus acetotolerans]QGV05307.1 hypothetical protein GJR85_07930 [Lactobacillus acetotolerans]QJD72900.1 hypothetical protein HG715_02650 [Lactobacillus acetotolerans]BAQ57955.1 conserved hypothetical protein [Lactobacillus acetotolerans]HBG91133.1 hypothetical protein [Lactobacillus acetotolerans]
MGKQNYRKKITFWLRFSGWLCLLPASVYLYLYQVISSSSYSSLYLVELIIVILFAVYLLTTAKNPRWTKTKNMMGLMIFALIFVSLGIFIPLCFAYGDCRKLNK